MMGGGSGSGDGEKEISQKKKGGRNPARPTESRVWGYSEYWELGKAGRQGN